MVVSAHQLGETLWTARKRAAWGKAAESLISRTPWPPHDQHPSATEEQLLAIAEARAVLALYEVTPHGR